MASLVLSFWSYFWTDLSSGKSTSGYSGSVLLPIAAKLSILRCRYIASTLFKDIYSTLRSLWLISKVQSTRINGEEGREWGPLYQWGVNDTLSIVASLYFWGVVIGRGGHPEPDVRIWEESVNNVNWMMEGMAAYYELFGKNCLGLCRFSKGFPTRNEDTATSVAVRGTVDLTSTKEDINGQGCGARQNEGVRTKQGIAEGGKELWEGTGNNAELYGTMACEQSTGLPKEGMGRGRNGQGCGAVRNEGVRTKQGIAEGGNGRVTMRSCTEQGRANKAGDCRGMERAGGRNG
ncbi:hypothetical protein C8R45DRAFT_920265 [Mycena sanguinolenta]|nr:hypothetical protein C8R45DRAFT_920265 [Mycena sanguinolenta]